MPVLSMRTQGSERGYVRTESVYRVGLVWVGYRTVLGSSFLPSSNAKQIAEIEPAGAVNSRRLELEGVGGVQSDH